MTKIYNVILSTKDNQPSNILVREQHLDDYLYFAGFAVKDCYLVGELFEPGYIETDGIYNDEEEK